MTRGESENARDRVYLRERKRAVDITPSYFVRTKISVE